MEEFGVTSIPALILLNGEGAVVCWDGQEQLRADPTGRNFPWTTTSLCTPRVGFDLTAHIRPDVARLARPVRPPTITTGATQGKHWYEAAREDVYRGWQPRGDTSREIDGETNGLAGW
jgi:hypothetical protein